MFAVGMFNFWGVDEGMTRSKEREEKSENDGEPCRSGQRSPDGVDLELKSQQSTIDLETMTREHTADLNGSWISLRNSSAPSRRQRALSDMV